MRAAFRIVLAAALLCLAARADANLLTTGVGAGGFGSGGGGGGSIAYVNQQHGNDYTGTIDTSIAAAALSVTSGNLLLVTCRYNNTTVNTTLQTPTDTAGNTFAEVGTEVIAGTGFQSLWYAKNVTGNASDVVTCNLNAATGGAGFTNYVAIGVSQFSGLSTSGPLDANASGTSSSGNGVTSGGFTTTVANELLFAGCSQVNLSITYTAGSGYTIAYQDGSAMMMEYEIVSSIQTGATASFTASGSATPSTIVVGTFH